MDRVRPAFGAFLSAAWRTLLVLTVAALGVVVSDRTSAAACRDHQYAVYLSPGHEDGVRWGGYHATLTGFSASHVCGGSMNAVLQKAWQEAQGGKPYSFRSKTYRKDYREFAIQHPWGRKWGMSFNSNMLTGKLVPLLRKGGFEKLKSHWHVSLYSDDAKAAVSKFESQLKNESWRLWLVRLPDKLCQNEGKGCPQHDWTEIR